ncbi:uncharacterized protein LOC110455113 isoform X2 [Mizuhopecten yessoensis]|uniref:uncharacterized protein LOC110455113 isoform X2 n=1 Tax=Mizuhopecten yessoensis TaxID=6573 RepID=UPI000B45EB6D|nr:uncharacterized protein LOC110455113 isoform X2 [Mizuhopecten yessoensis]
MDEDVYSIFAEYPNDDVPVNTNTIRRVQSASASSGNNRMLLRRRGRTRPLGLVLLDSRLETQVEKAVFQTNLRLLTQMVGSQKNQVFARPNTPVHEHESPSLQSKEYQIINNATTSCYHNKIRDRVVSAGGERRAGSGSRFGSVPLCSRQSNTGDDLHKCQHKSHCDVLGSYFCTDCTQIRKRSKSAQQQTKNFPNIEVHPRSLVAPEKLDKLLIKIPQMHEVKVSDKKRPSVGNGNRFVFTGNDIYSRLRETHKLYGRRVFGQKVNPVPKTAGLLPNNLFDNHRSRRRSSTLAPQKTLLAVPKANTHMIRFDIPSSR